MFHEGKEASSISCRSKGKLRLFEAIALQKSWPICLETRAFADDPALELRVGA